MQTMQLESGVRAFNWACYEITAREKHANLADYRSAKNPASALPKIRVGTEKCHAWLTLGTLKAGKWHNAYAIRPDRDRLFHAVRDKWVSAIR
jgi:hypothetical protein